MDLGLQNLNPKLYEKQQERIATDIEWDNNTVDDFDSREIFDLLRHIKDPEHPFTLEEINVVEERLITVDNENNTIDVQFTPTIPHCTLAQLIGLSIRVQLLRCLPPRFKVTVAVTPGSHYSEHAVNKQLADKERVAAALENTNLIQSINKCIVLEKERHHPLHLEFLSILDKRACMTFILLGFEVSSDFIYIYISLPY